MTDTQYWIGAAHANAFLDAREEQIRRPWGRPYYISCEICTNPLCLSDLKGSGVFCWAEIGVMDVSAGLPKVIFGQGAAGLTGAMCMITDAKLLTGADLAGGKPIQDDDPVLYIELDPSSVIFPDRDGRPDTAAPGAIAAWIAPDDLEKMNRELEERT